MPVPFGAIRRDFVSVWQVLYAERDTPRGKGRRSHHGNCAWRSHMSSARD